MHEFRQDIHNYIFEYFQFSVKHFSPPQFVAVQVMQPALAIRVSAPVGTRYTTITPICVVRFTPFIAF